MSGSIDYCMPKLAMAMNEGTINEWLVTSGDHVEAGTPIAVIETEKTAYDCEAPVSGYLEILVGADQTVAVETLIGRFHDAPPTAEPPADPGTGTIATAASVPDAQTASTIERSAPKKSTSDATAPAKRTRVIASPAARKLARSKNIDLSEIVGTGPKGRIVKRDVIAVGARTEQTTSIGAAYGGAVEVSALKGGRGAIAKRMVASLAASAQVSGHFEADFTEMAALRARLVSQSEKLGSRVSMNALIIKAICHAIREVPAVNACLHEDRIERYERINLGMAVARPEADGVAPLVVAVLHDIGHAGVLEIHERLQALLARVRDGQATPDDLQGSTISLSSTAGIAPPGMTSTPILNPPNVFMIGTSTPIERPQLINGELTARQMLPVSYTFDHRAIDGEPTARFLSALNERLQEPALLLT